jgi:hypothetical protein
VKSIDAFSAPQQLQYFTTIRKQWKCVEDTCEEQIIKCNNGKCDTTKNEFKSQSYQPVVPQVEKLPIDLAELQEILKFPQPLPTIDFTLPFDNSGLIDLIGNMKNFSYYFSNSKHINKKCQNKVCTITTRSCVNEKCEETTTTQ